MLHIMEFMIFLIIIIKRNNKNEALTELLFIKKRLVILLSSNSKLTKKAKPRISNILLIKFKPKICKITFFSELKIKLRNNFPVFEFFAKLRSLKKLSISNFVKR